MPDTVRELFVFLGEHENGDEAIMGALVTGEYTFPLIAASEALMQNIVGAAQEMVNQRQLPGRCVRYVMAEEVMRLVPAARIDEAG